MKKTGLRLFALTLSVVLLLGCPSTKGQDGQPCPGAPTVKDYDGNTYNTVQIGQQCWMRENLRTTHYADGTAIPSGGSRTSSTSPYYYDYSFSGIALTSRGYLYNWPAAMHSAASSSANPSGVQGICPNGWHLPSDGEWKQFTNYVSSQSEYQCDGNSRYIAQALASTTGWEWGSETCTVGNTPSTNNATGFSAVPAGDCNGSSFSDAYLFTAFFSSMQDYRGSVWLLCLYHDKAYVRSSTATPSSEGYSVRCLRDNNNGLPTVTTNMVSNITATSATCGGNVTADGGATVTARGVCWSTSQYPMVSNSHTTDGSGTGSFTSNITGLTAGTTYYVRAYATNSAGTAYSSQVSFTYTAQDGQPCPGAPTVKDYDGNTYNTVQIGQQCWMRENLRTTHYADGTAIPSGDSRKSSTSPYYYDYSFSSIALTSRGYLYNWPAAMHSAASSSANPSGVQGICPNGWHLPSEGEWKQFTNYVSSQYQCNGNSYYIAKALASTTGWGGSTYTCTIGNTPSTNNATGFSAVPAGDCNGSSFEYAGTFATFWSSTQDYKGYVRYCSLHSYYPNVDINKEFGYFGFSVRCLRD